MLIKLIKYGIVTPLEKALHWGLGEDIVQI